MQTTTKTSSGEKSNTSIHHSGSTSITNHQGGHSTTTKQLNNIVLDLGNANHPGAKAKLTTHHGGTTTTKQLNKVILELHSNDEKKQKNDKKIKVKIDDPKVKSTETLNRNGSKMDLKPYSFPCVRQESNNTKSDNTSETVSNDITNDDTLIENILPDNSEDDNKNPSKDNIMETKLIDKKEESNISDITENNITSDNLPDSSDDITDIKGSEIVINHMNQNTKTILEKIDLIRRAGDNDILIPLLQKQLDILISINKNIQEIGSDLKKPKDNIQPPQPILPPPEPPIPDSETILFYMDENNLELSRFVLELLKERAKGYKIKFRVIQNNVIDDGKLAIVCYLNGNVQRLEEYPKQLINSISESNKTNGNVILLAVTPVNSWSKAKRVFSSTDIEELNEKGSVCTGLFLNDNLKKEYMMCRLLAAGDHSYIYPIENCEHNKYNVEHIIDRVFFKLFQLK